MCVQRAYDRTACRPLVGAIGLILLTELVLEKHRRLRRPTAFVPLVSSNGVDRRKNFHFRLASCRRPRRRDVSTRNRRNFCVQRAFASTPARCSYAVNKINFRRLLIDSFGATCSYDASKATHYRRLCCVLCSVRVEQGFFLLRLCDICQDTSIKIHYSHSVSH